MENSINNNTAMSAFFDQVINKIIKNVKNNYDDNYDEDRFGPRPNVKSESGMKSSLKKVLFKNRVHVDEMGKYMHLLDGLRKYESGLSLMYSSLADDASKELLVDIMAYRILGAEKVKLKTNTGENQRKLAEIKGIEDKSEQINTGLMQGVIYKFDLNHFGKDVKMYYNALGIMIDFFLEQYRYKGKAKEIAADPGDVVIDAGGCWGDTALYFADRVGSTGKVYTFEFIPNNITIFKKNVDLNPRLKDTIQLVDRPLWNVSGTKIFFKDKGPGSNVSFENFDGADGSTQTITIDDFIAQNNVQKVDFLKMDIEGAEGNALEGARKCIMQHKPKLAIAIYHSMEQFVDVPKWILDLNLGYKIYLDHFTIHAEETVVYAVAND